VLVGAVCVELREVHLLATIGEGCILVFSDGS
jgi:hypothetical protein